MAACVLADAWGASRVVAPAADLLWLREFFQPALAERPGVPGDATVEARREEEGVYSALSRAASGGGELDAFTLDGRFDRLPGRRLPGGDLVLVSEHLRVAWQIEPSRRRIALVGASDGARLRAALLRTVRELATVRALRAGSAPLHASAAVSNGAATLLVGARQAGKTTGLIHRLRSPGWSFLANDRSLLRETEAGWRACGMPSIVKVRSDTFDRFAGLRARGEAAPWHWERTLDEVLRQPRRPSRSAEGPSFSPAQFLHVVEAEAVGESSVGAILFPERDDRLAESQLIPLPVGEAARRLEQSLLIPGRLATSEAFDLDGPAAIDGMGERIKRLAAAGRCFLYRQGRQALTQPALRAA